MANGTMEHISDWGRALRIQGYLGCVISQDFLVVFLLLKYVYTGEIVAMLLASLFSLTVFRETCWLC